VAIVNFYTIKYYIVKLDWVRSRRDFAISAFPGAGNTDVGALSGAAGLGSFAPLWTACRRSNEPDHVISLLHPGWEELASFAPIPLAKLVETTPIADPQRWNDPVCSERTESRSPAGRTGRTPHSAHRPPLGRAERAAIKTDARPSIVAVGWECVVVRRRGAQSS
jgi:hypothetical protein